MTIDFLTAKLIVYIHDFPGVSVWSSMILGVKEKQL